MLTKLNSGIRKNQKIPVPPKKVDFHLANVDLDLESPVSIQPLLDELGDKVGALWMGGKPESSGGTIASLEIDDYETAKGWIYKSYNDKKDLVGGVDTLIAAFCELIENLSPASRLIWDNCHKKGFDAGFECGNTEKCFKTLIRPETIKRCADLGASISFKIYPHVDYVLRLKNEK